MAACAVLGDRSGTPETPYTITERVSISGQDGPVRIEIRQYGPRVAAEVIRQPGDGALSDNGAFRLLFDYISGANQPGTKVAMTVPVAMPAGGGRRGGEHIPMTTPVEMNAGKTTGPGGAGYAMRFFLPEGMTEETAPAPTDPRVRVVTLPGRALAVLRYTGWRTAEKTRARVADLLSALEGTTWRAVGQPLTWAYDPPWTLPFLRRNEVAVAVEKSCQSVQKKINC